MNDYNQQASQYGQANGYGQPQQQQPSYSQQYPPHQQSQYGGDQQPYHAPSYQDQAGYNQQQQPYQNGGYQEQQGYNHQQQPQYSENINAPQADGERGLAGAITGGLAGAVGGHQVQHGLLGTIGGAILGSFTEDKLKAHHMKKKSREEFAQAQQQCWCQEYKMRGHCAHQHDASQTGSNNGSGGFHFNESLSLGK